MVKVLPLVLDGMPCVGTVPFMVGSCRKITAHALRSVAAPSYALWSARFGADPTRGFFSQNKVTALRLVSIVVPSISVSLNQISCSGTGAGSN